MDEIKPKAEATWLPAYTERSDLESFGSAGLALFAMALKFGYDDLALIGADAIVDGPDDRGCDVIYIDKDQGAAIIAQSYRADKIRHAANAGKAATLRQAVSFLVEVDIAKVPERLKTSAAALRSALNDGDIDTVYVWFVHNCPTSHAVRSELSAVQATANSIIKANVPSRSIKVFSEEISSDTLESLYTDTSTPILVTEDINLEVPSGFAFKEGNWKCFVAPVPLSMLKSLYEKHGTSLFSVNVRDFLGMKAGDSNINFQMRQSLIEKPDNFFVYNNGLTVLTHAFESEKRKNTVILKFRGFSIVNGAQTTGTIGTSKEQAPKNAFVLARFICTDSEDLVGDVVRLQTQSAA